MGEVGEILKDIVEEDRRAGRIIQRLRLLLKKGDVNHEPVDVVQAVHDVVAVMRGHLVNQGVAIDVQPWTDPEPARVLGDRVQLQQVLMNLVMNGCDAMRSGPAGESRLTVRTSRCGDGRVRVAVQDQGVGIPAELLSRIFDPFVTTKERGLGLGLGVCRAIARAHGGEIWAENNSGEAGATLVLTLPGLAG